MIGSLVAYGWKFERDHYYSEPDKFGIIVSDSRFDEDVIEEELYKDDGGFDIAHLYGSKAVDVLWQTGLIEGCSVENLIEVGKCQTGN